MRHAFERETQDRLVWVGARRVQHDAGLQGDDTGSELDQTEAQRVELQNVRRQAPPPPAGEPPPSIFGTEFGIREDPAHALPGGKRLPQTQRPRALAVKLLRQPPQVPLIEHQLTHEVDLLAASKKSVMIWLIGACESVPGRGQLKQVGVNRSGG